MDLLLSLLTLGLVAVFLIFPIWAVLRIRRLSDEVAYLLRSVHELERSAAERERAPAVPAAPKAAAAPDSTTTLPAGPVVPTEASAAPATPIAAAAPPSTPSGYAGAPVIPPAPPPAPARQPDPSRLPPPLPVASSVRPPPPAASKDYLQEEPATINWELFMGVKLFAWIGGLIAFLAVAYLVKLTIDENLLSPEVRVALGFAISLGLAVGGVLLRRKNYPVTSQTLCAAGVVSLYAVTFAAHAFYQFAFFGLVQTFGLMVLITAAAFILAVRMQAHVVAILGMLGGFLTPYLLSTGVDRPVSLFSYLALLDAGLIAVALHRRWHYLLVLAALCTVVMQVGWAGRFLIDAKVIIAMTVCLVFEALFLAAVWLARRFRQATELPAVAVALLAASGLVFAFHFAVHTSAGLMPVRLLGFLFLVDLGLLGLALLDAKTARFHGLAGGAVFLILAGWTLHRLTTDLLPWALGGYFVFALLHSAFPLVLQRLRPAAVSPLWGHVFPVAALVLVIGPVLNSPHVSSSVWPAVLLIDLLAIGLAWFTGSLVSLAAALVLTLIAAGVWIFLPQTGASGSDLTLWLIAGFAALFCAAGVWLQKPRRTGVANDEFSQMAQRGQLPVLSVLLPFVLLVMAIGRLPLSTPTPVFGLALALAAVALGLARALTLEWVPACALAGLAAVSYAWTRRPATSAEAWLFLGWIGGFWAVTMAFPFLFHRALLGRRGPWIAAAASSVAFFPLFERTIRRAWPNEWMGLVPLAFAVPAGAGLMLILRREAAGQPLRLDRLALFGGLLLLFITLVFPLQFSRHWITLSWALEGAALIWLYRRVPHRGLPLVGALLLAVAFCRLAFHQHVLVQGPGPSGILYEWYHYAFAVGIVTHFFGARWLRTQAAGALPRGAAAALETGGTILAFLLLNLAVAHTFHAPTGVGHYGFSGGRAASATYTGGWSVFALSLLVIGVWKRLRAPRYAALALLGATVLKLFFHDLANTGHFARVVALFVVAAVAILASFVYQRFLPQGAGTSETSPTDVPR